RDFPGGVALQATLRITELLGFAARVRADLRDARGRALGGLAGRLLGTSGGNRRLLRRGGRRCGLGLLPEARLQGLHQVDDRPAAGLGRRDRDVLPLDLLLDQTEDALLDVVLVGLGLERVRRALVDEQLREVELLRADVGGLDRYVRERPDLVGVV